MTNMFQHTAARRRLAAIGAIPRVCVTVSTHSRPKAAGTTVDRKDVQQICFNTQPPEGGWYQYRSTMGNISSFNTQPPEGGWGGDPTLKGGSRSFNTQPPEGGWMARAGKRRDRQVSTHSRPKAAGSAFSCLTISSAVFQHTAARRRLESKTASLDWIQAFQHTAARRRLGRLGLFEVLPSCFNTQPPEGGWTGLSAARNACL